MRASEAGIAAANKSVVVSSVEAGSINKLCGSAFVMNIITKVMFMSCILHAQHPGGLCGKEPGRLLGEHLQRWTPACCLWFVPAERELTITHLERLHGGSRT